MRLLFLSSWFPYPPDTGSKIRVTNLLRALKREHRVTVITFKRETDPTWHDHRELCDELYIVPARPLRPAGLKAITGLVSAQPRSVMESYSPEMMARVRTELQHAPYAAIIASELGTAPYAAALPNIVKILDDIEIGIFADRVKSTEGFTRVRHQLTAFKLRRYLKRLLSRFDAWTVASEVEKAQLVEMGVKATGTKVLPNGVNYDAYCGVHAVPETDSLVFNGALTYSANLDAFHYFLADIYPQIQLAVPGARLYVTGSTKGIPVKSLPEQPHVHYTGYMEDIRPRVAASTGCVVPVRQGSGTRVKIIEALALGTPVVSTVKGAEGLRVEHGQTIMVARTTEEFGQHTIELLRDPSLRSRLAANGRALVQTHYDWKQIGKEWTRMLESTVESVQFVERRRT